MTEERSRVVLIDANATIGRSMIRPPLVTVDDLLREMTHLGIDSAVVTHVLQRAHHPAVGNPAVVKELEGGSRLLGAWTFLPDYAREHPPARGYVAEMLSAGVRVAKIFPQGYFTPLADWMPDPLWTVLEERRVPTFICPDLPMQGARDALERQALRRLCTDHPELPVIAGEYRIRTELRALYRLLDQCPNFHLELSGLWGYRAIEFICRTWGAERLIFGTNLPDRDGASTIAQLMYAEIDDAAKAAIGGGNLRRLIDGVRM
ncbi:MAG: amidohydrolase family protein [Phycisphaerae bacterium]|nr:amidohydrolase family protein [Phycisphaerae bacterium]